MEYSQFTPAPVNNISVCRLVGLLLCDLFLLLLLSDIYIFFGGLRHINMWMDLFSHAGQSTEVTLLGVLGLSCIYPLPFTTLRFMGCGSTKAYIQTHTSITAKI